MPAGAEAIPAMASRVKASAVVRKAGAKVVMAVRTMAARAVPKAPGAKAGGSAGSCLAPGVKVKAAKAALGGKAVASAAKAKAKAMASAMKAGSSAGVAVKSRTTATTMTMTITIGAMSS